MVENNQRQEGTQQEKIPITNVPAETQPKKPSKLREILSNTFKIGSDSYYKKLGEYIESMPDNPEEAKNEIQAESSAAIKAEADEVVASLKQNTSELAAMAKDGNIDPDIAVEAQAEITNLEHAVEEVANLAETTAIANTGSETIKEPVLETPKFLAGQKVKDRMTGQILTYNGLENGIMSLTNEKGEEFTIEKDFLDDLDAIPELSNNSQKEENPIVAKQIEDLKNHLPDEYQNTSQGESIVNAARELINSWNIIDGKDHFQDPHQLKEAIKQVIENTTKQDSTTVEEKPASDLNEATDSQTEVAPSPAMEKTYKTKEDKMRARQASDARHAKTRRHEKPSSTENLIKEVPRTKETEKTPEQIAKDLAISYFTRRQERGARATQGGDFDRARCQAYIAKIKEGKFFEAVTFTSTYDGKNEKTVTEKSPYKFFKDIADNKKAYLELSPNDPTWIKKGEERDAEVRPIAEAIEKISSTENTPLDIAA